MIASFSHSPQYVSVTSFDAFKRERRYFPPNRAPIVKRRIKAITISLLGQGFGGDTTGAVGAGGIISGEDGGVSAGVTEGGAIDGAAVGVSILPNVIVPSGGVELDGGVIINPV